MVLGTLAEAASAGTETQTAEGTSGETGRSVPTSIQSPEERDRLPKDVIFELLSAERRRLVLDYLAENGGETTLGDLADHVAAKENGIEPQLLSSKQRKRVYIALYQCHLPKLDDTNVIDFESARGTVILRPEADALFHYLELGPPGPNGVGSGHRHPLLRKLRAVRAALVTWLWG